ncbi:fluoride efflux transporter CrcB [Atopobiaceae bacterium 24-176]
MLNILLVAAGGAAGSVARYLLSCVPVPGAWPTMTLITNFAGAVLIGLVAGLSPARLSQESALLLKTGLCGGFTTFSTFSLETVTLWQQGHAGLAALYATVSVTLCVAGVLVGHAVATALARN